MHIPTATYRLQFSPNFRFQEAGEILTYLSDLGISDIYASPIFQARKGSTHGYDIVDPNAVNSDLGSPKEFDSLLQKAKHSGLSWLQDIVPNHLAYNFENRMIRAILEDGRSSPFAQYFDINWDHPSENLQGRILAPFLGKFYSECLENGELKLSFDREGLSIWYHDLHLPLRIDSYINFFAHDLECLEQKLGSSDPDYIKYIGTIHSLAHQPLANKLVSEHGSVDYIKLLLWNLYQGNIEIKHFIDRNLEIFNGTPGASQSFDLLDCFLSRQVFRLSFCKYANEEINYRRFFSINELISLRIDRDHVFQAVHKLIFRLIDKGLINGLRVDHIDGLLQPSNYLEKLREKSEGIFIVVEKVLAADEELPLFWPIQGTTGYDFLNAVNALFIQGESMAKFENIYAERCQSQASYQETVLEKKRLISGRHLTGDIDNLAYHLKSISSQDRYARDVTPYGLKRALVEVMGHFTIYRTYLDDKKSRPSDQNNIDKALDNAVLENPNLYYELKLIRRFMAMAFDPDLSEKVKKPALEFVMHFQQITGPLMAKGFEDTFFYCYNRLISLNEVGGDPNRFGISIQEFHTFNGKRFQTFPCSLSATSTHDTKRGEDVRARLNVLSEIPREWAVKTWEWESINARLKKEVRGKLVPDSNDEYFLYQTLVGSFPVAIENLENYKKRITAYIVKSVREAKLYTGWLTPDTEYEEAFKTFAETILSDSPENSFLASFLPFQKKIAHYGYLNSLAQTLLKITAPGIPDFYQGSELWDFNLVDPDNRGPVDFEKRKTMLTALTLSKADSADQIRDLLEHMEDGRIKLFLIQKALNARKQNLELFLHGAYIPLPGRGKFQNQIISFSRAYQQTWALVITPRFFTSLFESPRGRSPDAKIWGDTAIALPEKAPRIWEDVLTGRVIECAETLSVASVLNLFPVALLVGREK